MKKNRYLSLLLALVMLFGLVSALGGGASAASSITVNAVFNKSSTTATVTWSKVNNATNYTLWILVYDSVNAIWRQLEMTKAVSIGANANRTYTFDKSNFIKYGYGSIGYRFRVVAFRDGTVIADGYSTTITTGIPILKAPQVLFSEGGLAVITPVSNATAYAVSLILDGSRISTKILKADSSMYCDFSQEMTFYNNYSVQVYASNPNFRSSKTVESNTITWRGQPTITGTVSIDNSAPTNGSWLRIKLGGEVAGIPAERIHCRWQRSDKNDGMWTELPTDSTLYTVSYDDVDRYLRVQVTADGYWGYLQSQTVHVSKETLKGTVEIAPDAPKPGDVLTSALYNNVSLISSDRLKYQWQRETTAGSGLYNNISGANSQTYITQSSDLGIKLRLRVEANGFEGYLYSNAVTVSNPHIEGTVTIIPASPKSGDTMTANLSGAVSGIPSSKIHYQWQYYGTSALGSTYRDITDAAGRTYVSNIPGRKIRVKVTADGYDGALYSSAVTVAEGGSTYQKGDVDKSGQVGNSDLIMVARHVVHLTTLTGDAFTLGDMNDDKTIDNKDIISLARKIVGLA